jgi:predicted ATP-binding protein involved in virulence
MRLKSATIRNFRCFEELEVQFHPRLTVLVAENGGGKTALLDAIASGLTPLLTHLSSANQRLSGPKIQDSDFRLEQHEASGDEVRWMAADYAQVVLETDDGLRWDQWRGSARGKQPKHPVGTSSLASDCEATLSNLALTRSALVPVVAYYGARRGWVVEPVRLRVRKQEQANFGHPTAALVGALDSLTDFREMLVWFDAEEAAELRANKPGPDWQPDDYSENPTLEAVRSALQAILGKRFSNPHFDHRHQFVVDRPEGGSLQVTQLSQGYQSMLALGMDFARRLAMANPWMQKTEFNDPDNAYFASYIESYPLPLGDIAPWGAAWAPAVMLVDEIDLHLHPAWQQRVLGDLMRAFPGTQFIVTTHSPQVLSTVKTENIRVLRCHNDRWTADPPEGDEVLGQASSVALWDVMEVHPTPYDDVEASRWYRDFLHHIEHGTHEDPKARDLRTKLETLYGPRHPLMVDADRLLRFQAFQRRAAPAANG